MPSFGQAHYIERSILSVLNQGYPATELIVIDGGSQDGTVPLLTHFASDLAYWCSEPDGGQSDALNKGFRHATGDIYGWLNSDDLYLPDAFHDAAALFAARPEIQVVYGDWFSVDPEERIVERHPGLAASRGRLITEGFFCNAHAMFWRRALHERCGEFDVGLHYTMDYDLMLRLISIAGNRGFQRMDRPLGCFRVYPGQKTGSANDAVAAEHRHIAHRAGTSWKYAWRGRGLRMVYRAKRITEYLQRCGPDYVLGKLRGPGSVPSS
jgi:glycosyltransferase involved in cell wall biosynthesis